MQNKIAIFLLALLTLCTVSLHVTYGQNGKAGLDAVSISKTYYNSIVKILLYDSAAAKVSPDLAYIGRGSGFFVTDDGYIFTNRHVIDYCRGYCRYVTYNKEEKKEEQNIDVYTSSLLFDPTLIRITYVGHASVIVQVYNNASGSNYTLYHAQVLVMDTANFDGAVLKIVSDIYGNPVTQKFHPVPLGNSDSTEQGEDLCLYGFPAQVNGSFNVMLNDLSTLMFGKHSGFDYNVNNQYGFIKTDAIINSGNSGGPVFGQTNNVIGIATAAFSKTNLGLIGGINDMYDLVSLIPGLKQQLLSKGFTAPQHKSQVSTAVVFKPTNLPSSYGLKKINDIKTGNKVSKSISITIGVYGEIPHSETHTIDDFTGMNTYNVTTTTNGGKSFAVPTTGYGISISLNSPSIFKNQEKNLLTGFYRVNIDREILKWPSDNLYTTPYATTFQMNSTVKSTAVIMFLGVTYARLLNNGVILGFYYGVGMSTAGINHQNIGTAYSKGQTETIYYNSKDVVFPQLFGINVRYKNLFVDIGYSFYTEKLEYTLPYDYYQGYFYDDYFVPGKIVRNPIDVTIGYSFYFYPKKH